MRIVFLNLKFTATRTLPGEQFNPLAVTHDRELLR